MCIRDRFGGNGYLATHSDAPGDIDAVQGVWLLDDMKYKFHACCHGTHAMIEALKGHDINGIAALRLRTNPRWLTVCDLKTPRTGLEVKFSYAWLAGMTLRGDSTGSDKAYTDALARDPALAEFARCVEVTGDSTLTDMQAKGEIQMQDGSIHVFAHDLAAPIPVNEVMHSLRSKARALLGQSGDTICDKFSTLNTAKAVDLAALMEQRT